MPATIQGICEEEDGERMRRVEENTSILKEIDRSTKGLQGSDLDAFQIMNVNLTTAATFLCDISKSLAVIADAMEKENASVTPQQKMGRWLPIEYDGYADGFPVWNKWECSECGYEHSGDEESLTAFCPDCGRKMEVRNDR